LIGNLMMAHLHPEIENPSQVAVGIRQLNPYFMAGWVGMLITGLNMLPISQLDGGHVIYALFGRRAHRLARTFLILAILFIILHFRRTGGLGLNWSW
jgi:membrane-associated protease RseP (regulator of RpoE activity)